MNIAISDGMNLEDLQKSLELQGIRFLFSSFVELTGTSKAKLVPITHLKDVVLNGAGFAGFAAGNLGQDPSSPDIIAKPALSSLLILPWRPEIAWVASDIYVSNKPWPYCPRGILKRQIARAADLGFTFKTGVETEFFLVKRDEQGNLYVADSKDKLAKPCYDQLSLTRNLDFLTKLIECMQKMGWQPYANDHEDANGQFEINWTYDDCLVTADRHVFMRYMVKTLAEQQGWLATFMPKPFADLTGSGAHFHMSLWDAEHNTPLFEDNADSLGLSALAYYFIGGLKSHARALAAITAPTVNSYKRLANGNSRSGATWAPAAISYGGNDRTQMLRVPAPGRVENRMVDGSCNPYLATAALLAAGLDGIENKLDPGKPSEANMQNLSKEINQEDIKMLPGTLYEAINALEQDNVIRAALGEVYAQMYISVKRAEWQAYHNDISRWEIDHYIEVY